VDIAAPGVDIMTTCPFVSTASKTSDQLPGRYRTYSGTSAASAHVTGAAALIKSQYPGDLSAATLKSLLFDSADHPPDLKGRCRSEGRLKIS
jgi:subtilisin family serine protease